MGPRTFRSPALDGASRMRRHRPSCRRLTIPACWCSTSAVPTAASPGRFPERLRGHSGARRILGRPHADESGAGRFNAVVNTPRTPICSNPRRCRQWRPPARVLTLAGLARRFDRRTLRTLTSITVSGRSEILALVERVRLRCPTRQGFSRVQRPHNLCVGSNGRHTAFQRRPARRLGSLPQRAWPSGAPWAQLAR